MNSVFEKVSGEFNQKYNVWRKNRDAIQDEITAFETESAKADEQIELAAEKEDIAAYNEARKAKETADTKICFKKLRLAKYPETCITEDELAEMAKTIRKEFYRLQAKKLEEVGKKIDEIKILVRKYDSETGVAKALIEELTSVFGSKRDGLRNNHGLTINNSTAFLNDLEKVYKEL